MNVAQMAENYLTQHGYDGLYNSDTECECKLDDLMACMDCAGDCEAGYFRKSTKEEEERTGRPWRIQKEKP